MKLLHALICACLVAMAGLLPGCASTGPVAGRDYVTPEDVKAVAPSVLAHRITVRPELWMSNASGASVAAAVLASVPTPTPGGTQPLT